MLYCKSYIDPTAIDIIIFVWGQQHSCFIVCFQLYYGENKLIINEMMMRSALF